MNQHGNTRSVLIDFEEKMPYTVKKIYRRRLCVIDYYLLSNHVQKKCLKYYRGYVMSFLSLQYGVVQCKDVVKDEYFQNHFFFENPFNYTCFLT